MARILIVDDNEQTRYMTRFLLHRDGHDVVTAPNGEEALEKAHEQAPDLLVADILMPVMDGFTLCRRWKKDDDLKDIPFLFYTATYTDPKDEAFALGLGADRFIVKPMEPDVFVAEIRDALDRIQETRAPQSQETDPSKTVYLKEYNEALIRKLEEKLAELEETNQALEQEVTERTQVERALRRQAARLEALHEIDRTVLNAHPPEETARMALDRLRRLVPSVGAGITLVDEDAQEAVVFAVHTERELDLAPGMSLPFEGILDVEALRGGQVLVQHHLPHVSAPGSPEEALQRGGVQSYLAAPLVVQDKLIGALALGFETPDGPPPEDLEVVAEIAGQIAMTLQQARLRADLQNERTRLRTTVERVPEGLLLLDADRRILVANPAARDCFPELVDHPRGDTLESLGCHPLDDLLEGNRDDTPREIELPGPPHRVVELLVRPVDDGDRQDQGWVLTVRDVTQEREAQAYAYRQERLAAVGQLAGGIAHDFNNFLTSMMLYSNLILRDQDLPHHLKSAAETIIAECRRAADLIRRILDFSRRSPMALQPVDLVAFLGEVLQILADTLPETINLVTEIEPSTCTIQADPTRIQQVVMNLAINARDAMPGGGELTISLSREMIAPDDEKPVTDMSSGEWVCLAVSDTGTGMTDDVKDRLFEPFFTTKEPGQGTGLGLAQVYGIVTHHQGFINVETEPGQGTAFYVYLPVPEHIEADQPEPPAAARSTGSGETVLLVEDHDAIRDAGRLMLEHLGYRALAAANGEEALDLLRTTSVDLVITDIVMPRMGGQDLRRALAEAQPDLPVVAITGHALDTGNQTLEALGFSDILIKPLDPDCIARTVRRVLDESCDAS